MAEVAPAAAGGGGGAGAAPVGDALVEAASASQFQDLLQQPGRYVRLVTSLVPPSAAASWERDEQGLRLRPVLSAQPRPFGAAPRPALDGVGPTPE